MNVRNHQRRVARSILKTILVLSVHVGLCTTPWSVVLSGDGAELIRRYEDFRNSIRSWRYDYTIDYIDFGHGVRESPGCVFTVLHSGRRMAVFSEPQFDYGTRWIRLWQSWDGRQSASLGYFSFDSSLVNYVEYTSSPPIGFNQFLPASLALGWQMRGHLVSTLSGVQLSSLLRKADASEIRRVPMTWPFGPRDSKEFSAIRWPVLRFVPPAIGDEPTLEHTLTVYFAPEQDWLPRLWCVLPTGCALGEELPAGAQPFSVFTEEFIDVDDPILKRPRKFPSVVIYGGALYELTSVHVNQAIEPTLLEPEITPGAKLIYNPGSRMQRVTFAGGDDGEAIHRKLTDKQRIASGLAVPEPSNPTVKSVSAKPTPSIWLPQLVVLGSMVLLIVSVVLRVRAAR